MGRLNDRGFAAASKYGVTGEEAYIRKLEECMAEGSIMSYIDLRENPLFRLLDCDFVVFTRLNGDVPYTERDAEDIILKKGEYSGKSHTGFCRFIEIKADTKILDTGNIYLEWVAHNKPGCFSASRADNWVYYGLGPDGSPAKAWSVDFRKTRALITSGELGAANGNEYRDKTVGNYAYRVPIGFLVDKKAAKEIEI